MRKIVGNKESFAIEINVTKSEPIPMGGICIWVDNIQIGAFGEKNMILPHLNSLKFLAERIESLSNQDFSGYPIEKVFNDVYDGSDEDNKFHVSLGEAFDDFYLVAYKTDQNIVLCAKLTEESFFEYNKFPTFPVRREIPLVDFLATIDQISQIANALKK